MTMKGSIFPALGSTTIVSRAPKGLITPPTTKSYAITNIYDSITIHSQGGSPSTQFHIHAETELNEI